MAMRPIIQDIKRPRKTLREVLPKEELHRPPEVKNINVVSETTLPPTLPPLSRSRRGGRSHRGWLWLLVVVVLAIAGLVFGWEGKVSIVVTPKQEEFRLVEMPITVQRTAEEGAPIFRLVNLEMTDSKILPSAGREQVSRKASGRVIIYNRYNQSSQRLIKTTRLEATNGKIYRIDEAVIVPGQKVVDGKLVDGQVEVMVYADAPGEEYNQPATDFTIPGFRGTPQYSKFTAKSQGPLSGGALGEWQVVTDNDRQAGEAELSTNLRTKLISGVAAQVPPEFAFYEPLTQFSFEEIERPATNNSTYELAMRGQLTAVILDKASVGRALVTKGLPKSLDYSPTVTNWSNLAVTISSADLKSLPDTNKLTINFSGVAQAYWQISESEIINSLMGARKNSYSNILASFPAISGAEARFSVPWMNRFPDRSEQYDIEINLTDDDDI
ncbi:MAG: hypothetical protein AAB468_00130 [Patescibacteria group bacterium]